MKQALQLYPCTNSQAIWHVKDYDYDHEQPIIGREVFYWALLEYFETYPFGPPPGGLPPTNHYYQSQQYTINVLNLIDETPNDPYNTNFFEYEMIEANFNLLMNEFECLLYNEYLSAVPYPYSALGDTTGMNARTTLFINELPNSGYNPYELKVIYTFRWNE